jgi:trehalose synthase
MFTSIPTTPKSLEHYRPFIGDERLNEIRRLAERLQGARVLHFSSTAFGGGVAELLNTLVPLMQDVGLQADWQVMHGADEFFTVTKAIHNGLQGMFIPWTPEMRDIWLRYNDMNAGYFDGVYDFVVVHDPQPAGLLHFLQSAGKLDGRSTHWLWRCHIDLTEALPDVWDFLRPYLEPYDLAIFTMEQYAKADLRHPWVRIAAPAIDPLSPKNMDISEDTIAEVLRRYGLDPARPMMLQVSRFDPFKDPLGVIDVYRMVKEQEPRLQLLMVASMASDDPEGWSYFERTARRAGEDYDIHLLSNLNGVGNVEVNAFQRAADVVVQKSLREGFGLVISEALWKGVPVVAGNVGGIPLQVLYGETGFLINTLAECADRILYLIRAPEVAERMGKAGREHVREHFLITRYLRDYLGFFGDLAAGRERPPAAEPIRAAAGG